MQWIRAGKGIRYYEHEKRKYGNHLDRYYVLSFKFQGKTYNEALGWESENRELGRSMLQRAEELMAKIRQNRRTGEGPVTKKERLELAEARKAEERRKQQREELKNISLDAFFEQHFKPIKSRSMKPDSFKNELSHYNIWIKDVLGEMPIKNINLMAWDKLISNLDKKTLSKRTRRYICGTLCRILRFAGERGYETVVPTMKQLGLTQNDNRRLRVITEDEIKSIFAELKELNVNAYNLTSFAFFTGCRFGEAASLKWTEILDNSIIFLNTKNGTTRQIPMPQPVREILTNMDRNKSEFVFTNDHNQPYMDPPTSFKIVVNRLGLNEGYSMYNKITFHSLRHTAATYMARYLDVRSLMDIFGWKNISMAARYMHGNEVQKTNALNSLASYLEEGKRASVIPFASSRG